MVRAARNTPQERVTSIAWEDIAAYYGEDLVLSEQLSTIRARLEAPRDRYYDIGTVYLTDRRLFVAIKVYSQGSYGRATVRISTPSDYLARFFNEDDVGPINYRYFNLTINLIGIREEELLDTILKLPEYQRLLKREIERHFPEETMESMVARQLTENATYYGWDNGTVASATASVASTMASFSGLHGLAGGVFRDVSITVDEHGGWNVAPQEPANW